MPISPAAIADIKPSWSRCRNQLIAAVLARRRTCGPARAAWTLATDPRCAPPDLMASVRVSPHSAPRWRSAPPLCPHPMESAALERGAGLRSAGSRYGSNERDQPAWSVLDRQRPARLRPPPSDCGRHFVTPVLPYENEGSEFKTWGLVFVGAPGRTRTSNPQIRSLVT